MLALWQTLPARFDAIAFHVMGFGVPWYTLCYLTGIFLATLYFIDLARRRQLFRTEETVIELILSVLWGVIIGARLGYVLLYGDASYWAEPWRIVSPYDFSLHTWVGIRGLSFHGGLVGGMIGLWRFAREAQHHFWQIADVLVQAVPIGLFFGRVGNFLNHELIGRPTEILWGMQLLPTETMLRHPVTLYEALGEGVLLFCLLLLTDRLRMRPGVTAAVFLIGYGLIRFCMEWFRQVEIIPSLGLSMGQAVSVVMVLGGVYVFIRRSQASTVVQ